MKDELSIIRRVLRKADKVVKSRGVFHHCAHDDGEFIYNAMVHMNTHAGGYVYFAEVLKKNKRGRPKRVFSGRWNSWLNTVEVGCNLSTEWLDRCPVLEVPVAWRGE